jgi:hypothetical protein
MDQPGTADLEIHGRRGQEHQGWGWAQGCPVESKSGQAVEDGDNREGMDTQRQRWLSGDQRGWGPWGLKVVNGATLGWYGVWGLQLSSCPQGQGILESEVILMDPVTPNLLSVHF